MVRPTETEAMPARRETEVRRRRAVPIVDSKAEAVAELMLEVAQCFFKIRAVGQKTGLITSWGGGAFGFIRSLALLGPLTVPQIAQMRPTSRQRTQRLAGELAAEGLMEFVDNPKHQRSKLVRLTPKGDARYLELNARLLSIASTMGVALSEADIRTTTEIVPQLRKALPLGMTRSMGDQRVQRRLAAIFSADAVGNSRLMENDEQGTLVRLNSLRREVFQPKIK
jgi:DNA-binding MarR family transcriptional regulator